MAKIRYNSLTKHHKATGRPVYACGNCGHHVSPMAGTIMEHSSTPLRLWFYAMFLMASTRCGISAKQLERELGVTYKTTWRILKQIRSMLAEDLTLEGSSRGESVRPRRCPYEHHRRILELS